MNGHEDLDSQQSGRLYVVATPIGNLDDLSSRACATLKQAARIYAEDTRTSAVLLSHYAIGTPVKALHEHNEARAAAEILEYLRAGHDVALICDAGTPAVSDPGAFLVEQAHTAGVQVIAVPGPNAAVAAMSVAGFQGAFCFAGFLPAKNVARRKALETWRDFEHALVLYEAPHRIVECVEDIAAVMGSEREVVIARELTKRFEQTKRLKAGEASAWLQADANRQRGEFVLVIAGAPPTEDRSAAEGERILHILLSELPLKQAAKLGAQISGARKNALYELGLQTNRSRTTESDDE
jgi:16S rRNA (cytidine1402-2'-O)-methyltransferase